MNFFVILKLMQKMITRIIKKTWNKIYKSWNVNSKGQTPEKQEDVDVVYSMIINPSMDLEAQT